MKRTTKLYNYLIDYGFFTNEELNLMTNINGYNIATLNNCIYSRYGYRDIEQMHESGEAEGWEDYKEA